MISALTTMEKQCLFPDNGVGVLLIDILLWAMGEAESDDPE